jgi:hypothetical protein
MCSDAPSPDPQIGQAAMANAELAKEAMQYYRERDAAQAPRQAKMDALTENLANQQLDSSQFNDRAAREQFDRYRAYGIPAENAMYADAAGYDSKDALDKAAGSAATDVDVAMAGAADAQRRNMARSGVNPADGRALSMERDTATQGALAKASAMTNARDQRRQMGIMLRKDAASFGRGATGTAAQTFGTSMAAGGQASGAVGAAIGSANQTAQMMGTGFNLGIQGNGSAGSILNQEYGNQIKAAGDASSSTASLAGTAATVGIAI